MAGFLLLIPGALTILVLPEVGVPLILFGTRLLGEKFKWAAVVNARVDRGWRSLKMRVGKFFRKYLCIATLMQSDILNRCGHFQL